MQFSTTEEDLAFEIWLAINNRRVKTNYSLTEQEFLNELQFEIIPDFYNKDVLFSYVLKETTNIRNIELSLMTLGIRREFKYNNIPSRKKYLAVWK